MSKVQFWAYPRTRWPVGEGPKPMRVDNMECGSLQQPYQIGDLLDSLYGEALPNPESDVDIAMWQDCYRNLAFKFADARATNVTLRHCAWCGEYLPTEKFETFRSGNGKHYLRTKCQWCKNQEKKLRSRETMTEENKQKKREYTRKWRQRQGG